MNLTQEKTQATLLSQLSEAFKSVPFMQVLGLKLDYINSDHVILSFEMKDDLVGNYLYGILHGGVISSVLDMAGGLAVMVSVLQKHPECNSEELMKFITKCGTVDLQISFLAPGHGKSFRTKAWLIKTGQKISFARMELYNQDNTLIAMGTGTYLLK